MVKTYQDLISEALQEIEEIMPWDLPNQLEVQPDTLLLDIREPDEYAGAFLENSLHIPRGLLEQACEWGYAETIPELVNAKERPIVVVCRSGNRSALAALTLKTMGYKAVFSLKLGIKGCNDADIPLIDAAGEVVDPDWADDFFNPPVAKEQVAGND